MNYQIIINPSHGGEDYGILLENAKEKDITLEISQKMYDIFTKAQLQTNILRQTDETIPLEERLQKIKALTTDNTKTILITNHFNPTNEEGVEIIYSLKDQDTLPKTITKELIKDNCQTKGYYQKRYPENPMLDYDFLTRNVDDLIPLTINYSIISEEERQTIIEKYITSISQAIKKFIKNQSPKNNYYEVQKGDTIEKIAKQYDISVQYLKDLNNMTEDNIKEKEILIVPLTTLTNIDSYTVQAGDTLWNISKKNNITVEDLKEANNLNSNLLKIGQTLLIPKERIYKVEEGDSIYNISQKFDTDIEELIKSNDLQDRSLNLGEELIIPQKK